MEKRIEIPKTQLSLCPIGLGTVGAGLDWDHEEADYIFDTYLDLGGNVIDSARVYSDWVKPEVGRSERVIGDWIRRSGKRDKVVLITKGGHPDMTCEHPDTHANRMTRKDMEYDLECSLRTLGTDYIDIYFYHRDDLNQTVPELIDIMESFVAAGKIRYYGCSNWSTSRIIEADHYAERMNYRGFVANQALLNLGLKYMNPLEDDTMVAFDDDMFQYHRERKENLAMPYMAACSGFFHMFLESGEEKVKKSPYYSEGNIRTVHNVMKLMRKYRASVSQILLGFFSQQEFPCIPLYGPQDAEQLRDAMGTLDIRFSGEDFIV